MPTRHSAILALALCLPLISGCPKPPPIHNSGLTDEPSDKPINPTWTANLPPELTEVRLHAYDDCLFVTAEKGKEALAPRVQLCVDPQSGEVRWANTVEVSGSAQREDHFFATDTHLVYANRQQVVALDRKTGEVAWGFEDPDGLPIYSAFVEADTLIMSLGNRKIALLDLASGKWVRGFGVKDDALKQVIETDKGLVGLTISVSPDPKVSPRLVALALGEGGEADPTAEMPEASRLWQQDISALTFDVKVVDGIVISEFVESELWALDAGSGQEVWRQKVSGLKGELLYAERALYLHRSDPIDPELPRSPRRLKLLRVPPRDLPKAVSSWVLELDSGTQLLGVEEREDGDPRALGATVDTFFQFNRDTGQLMWSYPFDRKTEPGQWTNASSNGEAVFVYFEVPGKAGVLKRIPIIRD